MNDKVHHGGGLSWLALDHPRAASVIIAGIVVMGILAYLTTPRREDPQVVAPGFTVTTVFPGAEPSKVEELITKRLEDVFQELDDVEFIEGYSGRNVSYLGCKCFDDTEMGRVLEKVHKKVAEASRFFPAQAWRPVVTEFNTFDIPILIYAVSGDFRTRDFRVFTERMKNRIELVEGVSKVIIEGVEKRGVEIRVDPARLKQYGLSVLQVARMLGMSNVSVPAGGVNIGNGKYLVAPRNEFVSLDDIARTVIGFRGSVPVRLSDIATVRYRDEPLNYRVRFNRTRAATVSVRQKRNADIFAVTGAVKKVVEKLRCEFPPGLVVEAVSVQADGVERVVRTFESNLFMGSLLVGAIILWHLGLRSSLVVLSAIPLSIFMAIMFMSAIGMEFHKISIFSLVLVLGMMVDNGIVMAENIFRRLAEEEGDVKTIIVRAANQVAVPLLSSTMTTIGAFIPLYLMGGMCGKYIQSLPQTVVIALISSLATAVLFTPLFVHWVVMVSGGVRPGVGRDTAASPAWVEKMHDFYREKLGVLLDHKFIVILVSIMLFVASIKLIPLLGIQFFPKTDKGQFLVDVLMPAKYDLEASDEGARQVENVLARSPGLQSYLTFVGKGVPRFHYNIYRRELATYVSMLVSVRRGWVVSDIIAKLRDELGRLPGLKVSFQEVKEGPKAGMPVSLRVQGPDYSKVILIAARLEEQLKTIPGAVDVERDEFEEVPGLKVKIDETKARLLGVDGVDVSRTIRAAIEGLLVTNIQDAKGDELDVVLKLSDKDDFSVEDLGKLEVLTDSGTSVPLDHISTISVVSNVSIRYRRNARPSVRVRCRVQGVLPSMIIDSLKKLPKNFVPPGYVIEYGGDNEGRDRSFRRLGKAMLAAMLLIFLILVAQFNSFLQPLVVLFCLPLSIIGAVIGLFITGYPFGFMSFLGFVALSGIVVNDAILLFDFINYLRSRGMDGRKAIAEAGIIRHRAIYLTTVTTIFGLFPLALTGGPLWAPLGWVIIFGIAASTLLTLIVIPVGYALVERL